MNTQGNRNIKKAWKILRPLAVVLISAALVVGGVSLAVRYVLSHFVYPVDETDNTPIEVVVPSGSSASTIASILYNARGQDERGLIVSTASFKIYVDFVGKANSLKAGTYILSRNMSIKEIVEIISKGNEARKTRRFTIPEGYTVTEIAAVLFENGLVEEQDAFLALCKDSALFTGGGYLDALTDITERNYALEGYLFPDTYEVYTDASPEEIIRKMLSRFQEVFTEEYAERAGELGMTTDQVLTLASMIEKEAAADEDFARVSAVFHNRLNQDMALESCATLSYALGVKKYSFSAEEIATVSPYNTYKSKGLPPGPICNPGEAAIKAALYPDEEYMAEGYLYFCNANPSVTKNLLFSRTYEEHQKKVQEYSQYWD